MMLHKAYCFETLVQSFNLLKYNCFVFQALVPVIMAIIAQLIVMGSSNKGELYPPLKMSLADYEDPVIYYQSDFMDTKIEDVFKVGDYYLKLQIHFF
jgi:hypothetical protein